MKTKPSILHDVFSSYSAKKDAFPAQNYPEALWNLLDTMTNKSITLTQISLHLQLGSSETLEIIKLLISDGVFEATQETPETLSYQEWKDKRTGLQPSLEPEEDFLSSPPISIVPEEIQALPEKVEQSIAIDIPAPSINPSPPKPSNNKKDKTESTEKPAIDIAICSEAPEVAFVID